MVCVVWFVYVLIPGCPSDRLPARLGKGQGAKEIGHNLARERPKFGHNLVHKRQKTRARFRALNDLRANSQNSGTIQYANETGSGHNFVGDR